MALLILLILWLRRLSAAAAYRLIGGIWLAGVPLLLPGAHYYEAFLHCLIGVLYFALASACAARARAPRQVNITTTGPVHVGDYLYQ